MSRYLPQALGATGLVVAGPVIAVWALRAWQLVGSTALAVVLGVVLSLVVSFAGSAYWANRESSRDVLFSELMIWGWLRRWRAEHKLTAALERLARLTAAGPAPEETPGLTTLKELATALEAGDPYTRNHSRRVARYASMIAERMGLPAEDVDRIRTAAAVHDVGKVRTPIEVLHKPGRLTDEEYGIIKLHPVDGAQLVEALGDDRLTAIVRHHHERLDGRGYPDGLRGEEIPLGARIVSVADTFDAITSARPYRPASPHRKALAILVKEAGTQLDADAVRAFRACYTGRRPFALWMTLLAFPQRVTASLGSPATASAASVTKIVAAASTVAVVGGAAASARPLMIVPEAPRTNAAVTAAAATGPSPAPGGGTGSSSGSGSTTTAALGAKLSAPGVQTREHTLLRRPGNVARHFPTSPKSGPAAPRSSHAGSSPVASPTPPSVPVAAPSPSIAPVSTVPVSTVAAVPTTPTAPASKAPTKGKSDAPTKGKKDAPTKGKTATPTKDHGRGSGGSGSGKGKGNGNANGDGTGNGNGTGHAKGKGHGTGSTPTTPTTTTPTKPTTTTTGKGKGTVNGAGGASTGNGNTSNNTDGNGKGKGTGTGSGSTSGTGGGKASDPTGNGTAGGSGDASTTGTGTGTGAATGTGTGNGAATGAGSGIGGATGSGNGAGTNGSAGTNRTGGTNGNGGGKGTGNGASFSTPTAG